MPTSLSRPLFMITKEIVPISGSDAYLGTITLPGLREPAHAPHKHHWPLLCCPPGGPVAPRVPSWVPGGPPTPLPARTPTAINQKYEPEPIPGIRSFAIMGILPWN